ncbi:DUF4404 family protein [Janthinobacterium sp. 17J80-10]|uniref:DUF4404 family protein n=1 Tax=Janthinobacterium sp. 17J80-10 TaxID=2497863 RepID=UPI001005426E|nr:DUF4404 family protein [Janthinobacterium sp. 17J80-10]QAU33148.1 DUF4404 family protein [Janthinobacterium sp. 17J80-10]
MSNEQLKSTLKELHRHLESAGGSVDGELKNLLQVLDSDIHQLLQKESPAEETEEEGVLASRAQELAARFAAQHPQLEGALRQLGMTLERMGI